jgi:gamma-glutamyl-gamma-aminobutyrate hydrolase PuuD
MVTVPLSPDKKFYKVCGDSYIASSHIDWLNKNNVEIIEIPYNSKRLSHYFKNTHGLYLPSGGAFAGTQMTYYNCCKQLLDMAVKENNLGNYYPVWGGCMGFQQMLIWADGKDDVNNFLQKFDSFDDYFTDIKFTEQGLKSNIIHGIPNRTLSLMKKGKNTLNNHKLGITPYKFARNKKVSSFFKNVGTSKDRKGREFVAIIEGNNYPFFGVQWHPERNGQMNDLIKFFCDELKRSKKQKLSSKKINTLKKLYSKKVDCMGYSGNLYKKCDFYWHKKTSEHNKKLCDAAQLNEKENPDGTDRGV